MMKNAKFIAGNSSAGIREAPYYGIPTVNVGTRQNGRSDNPDIINTDYSTEQIIEALQKATHHIIEPKHLFGTGKSDEQFNSIISNGKFWNISKQKVFQQNNTSSSFSFSDGEGVVL